VQDYVRQISEVTGYPPLFNCDRADGDQVFGRAGSCWIDFSSTSIMTNPDRTLPFTGSAANLIATLQQ